MSITFWHPVAGYEMLNFILQSTKDGCRGGEATARGEQVSNGAERQLRKKK